MAEPEIIFKTIHGSFLYGMNHEGSDLDFYVVTTGNQKPRHVVENGVDTVTVSFPVFLRYAQWGSHQAVEALFSDEKVWHSHKASIKPYLDRMKVCGPEVYSKYERTIRAFCFGDEKRRRHAVRLSQNLDKLRRDGIFNPRMTAGEIDMARKWASMMEGEVLWQMLMS
jgi:hypothetical protein